MKAKPTEEQIKEVITITELNKIKLDYEIKKLKQKYVPYNLRQAGFILGLSHEWVRKIKKKNEK